MMGNLLRSKKGGVDFLPLFMVSLIILLPYMIVNLNSEIAPHQFTLGKISQGVLDSVNYGAKENLYIEMSAKQALQNTVYQLSKGMDFTCGEYFGAKMISNRSNECFKNVEKRFIDIFRDEFDRMLENKQLDIVYSVKVESSDVIRVIGDAQIKELAIHVSQEDETSKMDSIQKYDISLIEQNLGS